MRGLLTRPLTVKETLKQSNTNIFDYIDFTASLQFHVRLCVLQFLVTSLRKLRLTTFIPNYIEFQNVVLCPYYFFYKYFMSFWKSSKHADL